MGKSEEDQGLPSTAAASHSAADNARSCPCHARRFLGFRCILALLFSAAVFLSAVFWLPPFLHFSDQTDSDLDSRFPGHGIVASFKVEKPVPFLEDNTLQLVNDIFDEFNVLTTKVVIISLEPSFKPNITEVIFAVDRDPKFSEVSATAQSLIRASFESLVIRQSHLRLNTSLFGHPFLFEVLKFPGGFTVSPIQSAFLLQKVYVLFTFTLNFSIYEIQENFDELMNQLKLGLHLTPYENLYISLRNLKGSTVAAPTTVMTSVLPAIGNTPSSTRLKQLAQTITGSHARNLGLNNTVFGRVKQVRLSSILRHSLHGAEGSSPAPTPLPHPVNHHHHHHHHHHHYHHHHPAVPFPPEMSPTSAPAPERSPGPRRSPSNRKSSPGPENSYNAESPGCQNGNKGGSRGKSKNQSYQAPIVAPMIPPHHSAESPQQRQRQRPHPYSTVSHPSPTSSPLPSVAFASGHPPSKSRHDADSPDVPSVVPPLPSSSPAGIYAAHRWLFPLLVVLGLHL